MTTWNDLELELDAWTTEDREATLWWRDDDATTTTPNLERLLELASTHGIPLALAVIPEHIDSRLHLRLIDSVQVSVVQHGLSHTNHAPAGQKKAELGAHRSTQTVLADVQRGTKLLHQQVPDMHPVLVPPWNRIANDVVAPLCDIGIAGLSTFGARKSDHQHRALRVTNTHADIINWRRDRGFVGTGAILGQIIEHLQNRRFSRADATEPTGLLTHHLVHTEECWQFLSQLFRFTAGHTAARWLAVGEIFGTEPHRQMQV